MTVEKALQMIDNILAQVSLRRDEHMNVQQAMGIIKSAVHGNSNGASAKTPLEEPKEG